MDELPYDLDEKSVYYGKKNEIDLNYELSDGAKEVLNQNMQFMYQKCVESNINASTTSKTVKITTLKRPVLAHGVSMKAPQVFTFLMPLLDELNSQTQYQEKNIRFIVPANTFCEKIGVSDVFMQDDGGSKVVHGNLTITWNRTYNAVLITKFQIQANNRHATQLLLNN